MHILRPRQRCATCHGSGETDCFGMMLMECGACDGTGYSRELPAIEYVHPDLMYKDREISYES